jgi:hypothetical protein
VDNLRLRTTSVLATLLPFMLRMTPDEGEIVLASCQMVLRQGQARLRRFRGDLRSVEDTLSPVWGAVGRR